MSYKFIFSTRELCLISAEHTNKYLQPEKERKLVLLGFQTLYRNMPYYIFGLFSDPEMLSLTYQTNVHTNRCVRDSYISSNGIPVDIYNGVPNTPQRRYAKTMYSPAHILTPTPHSGLENQAYSSESHHRRSLSLIQATAPPPPPPAPPEAGEAIMMEDVRGGNYEQRQGWGLERSSLFLCLL